MELKEIMTRKEVAEYLGISTSYLSRIQHEIRQIRIGRSLRFRKVDIDEYIKSKTVSTKKC